MNIISGLNPYIESGRLPIFYGIVLLIAIISLWKFKFKPIAIFVVLVFNEGLFGYFSFLIPVIGSSYKIFIALFSIYLFLNIRPAHLSKKEKLIYSYFFLLCLVVIFSMIINSDPFLMTLSQLLKKYGVIMFLYFVLKKEIANPKKEAWIIRLFTWMLVTQIAIAYIKLSLLGIGESVVGSIIFLGGGPSNSLPVIGFLFIFAKNKGVLKNKDWFFIFLLLSISIIGNKRSVVFILPTFIICVLVFVRKESFTLIYKFIPLIIFVAVIGIKTNVSLNPEKSYWGSVDIDFLYNYVMDYTFGLDEDGNIDESMGKGRGGGLLNLIYNQPFSFKSTEFFFGNGLEMIVADELFDVDRFGVQKRTMVSAAMLNYIGIGILGTVLIFLYGLSFVRVIKNLSLQRILIVFLLWDYFFYHNVTIIVNAISILLVASIIIFNKNELKTRNT